jgi:hypothetical protein
VGLSNANTKLKHAGRLSRPAVVDTRADEWETGSEVRMKRILILSAFLLLLLGG